jgi:phage FluMu protein Com
MLRAFPFRTFDEIAELGLEVHVYCPRCYRYVGPIDLSDERLRGRPFTSARFVCGQTHRIYDASPLRVCGCLGQIIVRVRPADVIPPGKSVPWCEVSCPRCVPYWSVSQAAKHLPPWNRIWTQPDVRVACPACRSTLTTVWHGGDGVPFTDSYRREATPPSSPTSDP